MMLKNHREHSYICRILLTSMATLLCCSSLYEGQGLPTVEASFVVTQSRRPAASFPATGNRNNIVAQNLATSSSRPKYGLLLHMNLRREDEIRRKIGQFKRQGKIATNKPSVEQEDGTRNTPPPVAEQYGGKLRKRLGTKKARLLSTVGQADDEEDEEEDPIIAELDSDEEEAVTGGRRKPQLGSLPREIDDEEENKSNYQSPSNSKTEYKNFDASLFEDNDDDEDELSEEELVELVAEKLAEKRRNEQKEKEARSRDGVKQRLEDLKREQSELQQQEQAMMAASGKSTSGIGGRWTKNNETADTDYKPSKSGTWGVFDRPKDISRAFGGGKRVGAGYTPDNLNKKTSEEETRDRLKQYREKVGIDVQSEKDFAAEIEEALDIGSRAMQRGIYGTAVSALEKVTKYCSTNSPVGGKVFLELAMAYEAEGRTQEAITVYATLSKSLMEDIKINAQRLLYGIEAMQFMQNEARDSNFSRKKAANTFIDTTGMANFADNFDDVYNTAYIDLDKGFYRRLTESVVRSNREARQILLKAKGAGEVERLKVVQALRSISRHFDDALEEEIESNKPAKEPVAFMNGKPIVVEPTRQELDDLQRLNEFALASAEQMIENLNGEWELQLLADKRGDGVKYYNTSLSWQAVDTDAMTFTSKGSAGFLTVDQSGGIEFQDKRRILTRTDLSVSGTGGMFSGFLAKGSGGAAGAVSSPHQIVSVDSVLLITRLAPTEKTKKFDDSTKEYFAVWRKAEPGTFAPATP